MHEAQMDARWMHQRAQKGAKRRNRAQLKSLKLLILLGSGRPSHGGSRRFKSYVAHEKDEAGRAVSRPAFVVWMHEARMDARWMHVQPD